MSRIDEARAILGALGMPPQQRNDMSCLVLLSLAGMNERSAWNRASNRSLTIHQILEYMNTVFRRTYKENTRETVRRNVIHQFVQGRLVDLNPDAPGLPTNSPRTHYRLTNELLDLLRLHGRDGWTNRLHAFLQALGVLKEEYAQLRQMDRVQVRTSSGAVLQLSPGEHNLLQQKVVQEFAPRFTPGAELLYLGDAAKKMLHVEESRLDELGVRISEHDKLPDVILYDSNRKCLFLVEAVTSHGPVSPKRVLEIKDLLSECSLSYLLVTAFANIGEFRRHIGNIAWETEVWIAEIPDHLVHFDGESMLNPRRST